MDVPSDAFADHAGPPAPLRPGAPGRQTVRLSPPRCGFPPTQALDPATLDVKESTLSRRERVRRGSKAPLSSPGRAPPMEEAVVKTGTGTR
jgi:hypothetical protein